MKSLNLIVKKQIVGSIYKQPIAPVTEFTNVYLGRILEYFSPKKKEIILMGDFNINILNVDSDKDIADFVDTSYAPSLYPTNNTRT